MVRGPHRRYKGCPMCKSHKILGQGDAKRMPWPVLRSMGKRRRVSRKDVPDD